VVPDQPRLTASMVATSIFHKDALGAARFYAATQANRVLRLHICVLPTRVMHGTLF
jgi:hypothetical protein